MPNHCLKCEIELEWLLNEEDCFCDTPQSLVYSTDIYDSSKD